MITLVSIMLNEADMIQRWVRGIRRIPGVFDEIIVVDGGSEDETVEQLRVHGIEPLINKFVDFSDQRNFALSQASGDWIFELDADEIPSAPLLVGMREICTHAEASLPVPVDCIGIPRLNFLDDRLVSGPGHRGLDYQYRLHRQYCAWINPVHEEIQGYRARVELDVAEGILIQHVKTTERHEARNAAYRRFVK